MKRGEITFDLLGFPEGSDACGCEPPPTSFVQHLIYFKGHFPWRKSVCTLIFWFEKGGFLYHTILQLMNETLDLSTGSWFGSLWYAPLWFFLPAHTLGRVLAAIYIWHSKEWVHISLPCLLTGHGIAEQKQHIRAPFTKYFPNCIWESL